VVLWSGGYNTWTDTGTMFRGLQWAMERDPSIYFVSTGGQIDGHDEITYPEFVERITRSTFRDRFVLRGWIPRSEVADYYLEADVGLNCEKPIYEVHFGSKQRILDWSRAALPPISTRLTELSLEIERSQVGWVFPVGDFQRLGEILVDRARHRAETRATGERCRARMLELFGYSRAAAPLLDWLRDPRPASDRSRSTHCVEGVLWRQSILTRRVVAFERHHRFRASRSLIGADGVARTDIDPEDLG
jgi:glycosyltransferase involved in cell wall biosynthesis